MRVLIVDHHLYVRELNRVLQATGGELIWSQALDAPRVFTERRVDAAVVDILTQEDVGFALRACKEMSESDWGVTHPVIVYSSMTREDFVVRAAEVGLDLGKVQFYSKLALEVPPPLRCIEDTIRRVPSSIGILDLSSDIPKSITKQWLQERDSVYALLVEFVFNLVFADDTAAPETLNSLPTGLRMIWALAHVTGEVENGGFYQFILSISGSDGHEQRAQEVVDVARRMGLNSLASLVEQSIVLWRQFLCGHLQEDETIAKLGELDMSYSELGASWVAQVDAYVKMNPDEFLFTTA